VQLSKNVFSFLLNGTKNSSPNHIRIENDKFVIIKSGNCLMSESISLSQNYHQYVAFFSDKTVEDFLKKYDYKNNPKQNNDPFIITEYDRVIQNIVKVWYTFKRNLILSTKCYHKIWEILLYLVQMKSN
jgi:hypothetical protein